MNVLKSSSVNPEQHLFFDLIKLDAIKQMLQNFFEATQIANAILSTNGQTICFSGWQQFFSPFVNGINILSGFNHAEAKPQTHHEYLPYYSFPIEIQGHHIANLILGQILHTPANLAEFCNQAKQLNFDVESYIQAVRELPLIETQQIYALKDCILCMIQTQIDNHLHKHHNKHINALEHHDVGRHDQLEEIISHSPVASGWSNHTTGKIEYVNLKFTEIFGYGLSELADVESWYNLAYPNSNYRNTVIADIEEQLEQSKINNERHIEYISDIRCKNGITKTIQTHVSCIGDIHLTKFIDISAHRQTQQRLSAHDKMLEMIARAEPLADILDAIVQEIEAQAPGCICCIVQIDEATNTLSNSLGSSLPDFYHETIEGIEVGLGVASCGTAIHLGQRVVVEDIQTHPYWEKLRDTADSLGLKACWSEPIISSTGKVLGSFGIYHTYTATPDESDVDRIKFAANLAAIAIENNQTNKELEKLAYYDYLTDLPNRRHFINNAEHELLLATRYNSTLSILMLDIDYFKSINDTYGHRGGDSVLETLADKTSMTLRDRDIAGRIGGEEFAILLPETTPEHAYEVAERLRLTCQNMQILAEDGRFITFTLSIGISSYQDNNVTTIDELLHLADTALYQAKNEGRNCTKVFQ